MLIVAPKTLQELYASAQSVRYVIDADYTLQSCSFDEVLLPLAREKTTLPTGFKCHQAFFQSEHPCGNCPIAALGDRNELQIAAGDSLQKPDGGYKGLIERTPSGFAIRYSIADALPPPMSRYRFYINTPDGEKKAELFFRDNEYVIGDKSSDDLLIANVARKNSPRLAVKTESCCLRITNQGAMPMKVISPQPDTLAPGAVMFVSKEAFLESGPYRFRIQSANSSATAIIESRALPAVERPKDVERVSVTAGIPIDEKRSFILERIWPEFNQKMNAGELERQGLSAEELRLKTHERVRELFGMFPYPFDEAQFSKDDLTAECVAEFVGLGPLEKLLRNPDITEIMVNGPDNVYIEKRGRLILSDVHFLSAEFLRRIIERIVTSKNRRIDERVPYADTRLDDGSRVHAIVPPLAIDYPILTIRKFPERHYGVDDLIRFGSINRQMADLIELAVEHKQNIIVSGGTGTGKTTFLNICSRFIPEGERIITIEDSAELRLQKPHWIRLEARPANIEGEGAVPIRELVRNSLRMRPDRIVVGECRGAEAFDMLQAMNTGHEGSMTTLHANTCRDALSRVESMCLMAGMDLPLTVVRAQITSAVNIIIQLTRMVDGSRRCTMISELTGMDSGTINMAPLVEFKQTGMDENRRVVGEFQFSGIVPRFIQNLRESGQRLAESIYPVQRK